MPETRTQALRERKAALRSPDPKVRDAQAKVDAQARETRELEAKSRGTQLGRKPRPGKAKAAVAGLLAVLLGSSGCPCHEPTTQLETSSETSSETGEDFEPFRFDTRFVPDASTPLPEPPQ